MFANGGNAGWGVHFVVGPGWTGLDWRVAMMDVGFLGRIGPNGSGDAFFKV